VCVEHEELLEHQELARPKIGMRTAKEHFNLTWK